MKLEGKFYSDGKFIVEIDPDDDLIIMKIIFVISIVFFSVFGLVTITDYGLSFLQYIFLNYLFYVFVVCIMVFNTILFLNDISIIDTGIIEAIIGFCIYMYLGCKAYSVYGEWASMDFWMVSVCAFFGLIWMSLFFGIVSAAVCVGTAVLFCVTAELIEKRAPEIKMKAPKQIVRDFLQLHAGKYDDYNAAWKCSFCGEWVSMYYRYCDKCTRKRRDDDMVKSSDNKKKK